MNLVAAALTSGAHPGGHNGQDDHTDGRLIVANGLTSRYGKATDSDATDTIVAHTLSSEGADASGTGRGTPIVPVAFDTTQITSDKNYSNPQPGDPSHPLASGAHPPAVAYAIQERAETENLNNGPQGKGWQANVAYTLEARHHTQAAATSMAVRRLTATECERLQGFQDGWTACDADGNAISDSARYRMLGNAVAVVVSEWIGRRILEASTT